MVPAPKVAVARQTCLDSSGADLVVFEALSFRHVVFEERAKCRVRRGCRIKGMTDIGVSCRGKGIRTALDLSARPHLPFTCEAFHTCTSSRLPQPGSSPMRSQTWNG
jgi:hypothetical protein